MNARVRTRLITAVVAVGMALPIWASAADSLHKTIHIGSNATVAGKALTTGDYDLLVDGNQAKFTSKKGKVVAEVPCTWKNLPAKAEEVTQDRMPPIPANKLTDVQKKDREEVIAGPRGTFVGPFVPLLRSPDLMSRLQKVGEYLRYNTKLGANISEFVILIAARQWTQQFEWDSHDKLALKAGVKPENIAAVAEGRRPVGMTDDEEMAHDFCIELHHKDRKSVV